MLFKNIPHRIKVLAWILAILFFLGSLALSVLFVISAVTCEDATLRMTGFKGAAFFFALALLLPLCTLPLYGFAEFLQSSEKQAEADREIKELLRVAIAEGALAEDIARKLSGALAKAAEAGPAIPRAVQPQRAASPAAPATVEAEAAAPAAAPAAGSAPAPAATPEEQIRPLRPFGGEKMKF